MRKIVVAALVLGVSDAAWGQQSYPTSGGTTPIPCYIVGGIYTCTVTAPGPGAVSGKPNMISNAPLILPPDLPSTISPHHYTVADIDRMRTAVSSRVFDQWMVRLVERYPTDYPDHFNAMVEDRLRTYLAAGITAEELEAAK